MTRPCFAALAITAGVLLAGASPASAAPLPWLAALAVAALALRGRARVVAALGLGGAVLAAHAERGDRSTERALAGVDDRSEDRVRGALVGSIDESPDGWRFAVDVGQGVVEVAARGDPGERCGDAACGAADLLPGDEVVIDGLLMSPRGHRVPGGVDERRRLRARGAHAVLATDWARIDRVATGGVGPMRLAAAARRLLAARLPGASREAALLRGLVLGARGGVPPATAAAWRDAGMSHLLAVSGMHLAAVALLAFAALRRALAALPGGPADPARAAALAAAPLALAYTLVTGAPPSAVRALIALLVYFVGVALGRRASALDALGVAMIAIVLHRPAAVYDPSLQLSIAATAALALAGGGRRAPSALAAGAGRRALAWLERRAWAGLCASLAAAVATAPLTALHFGVVQPGGIVANLVSAPLTEVIALPCGLIAALLGEPGAPLAAAAHLALAGADRIAVAVAASLPPLWCGPPSALELALASAGLAAGFVVGLRRRAGQVAAGAAALGLLGSWVATTEIAPRLRRSTRVTFVDVGQGDAALVEVPGGAAWLIDGGGRPFVGGEVALERRLAIEERPGEAVVAVLGDRRVRRLDLVVLSHPHPDHYLGLRAIARRVAIGEVWLAASEGDLPADLAALLAALAARGTRIVHPPLGPARQAGGARLTVLWPRGADALDRRAVADPVLSVNDASLVVRLDHAGRRVLFAGDLEAEGEELLLAAAPGELAADVVKVAHHGSATSSTAAFVAATRPSLAVISCGLANRFGFPAAAVVDRWRAAGAAVRRTDLRGTVTLTLAADGGLSVATID